MIKDKRERHRKDRNNEHRRRNVAGFKDHTIPEFEDKDTAESNSESKTYVSTRPFVYSYTKEKKDKMKNGEGYHSYHDKNRKDSNEEEHGNNYKTEVKTFRIFSR